MGKSLKSIFYTAILLSFIAAFFSFAKPVPVQATAPNPSKTLIGCIRWDGQSGGDPWNVYNKEVQSLSPNEWHWRLPFYATEPTADSCTLNGNKQSIMDREIGYAKEAGIDYWAFCYYPANLNSGLDYAYNLYQASSHRNDINWCIIMGHSAASVFTPALVDEYVSRFKQDNYQKVLGNRPLLYFFGTEDSGIATIMQTLRTASTEAGLGDLYVVSMDAANKGSKIGSDAVSRYVTGGSGGVSYASVAEKERASWDTDKNQGKKVIPIVTSGWDPRPRMPIANWGEYALPDSWYQTATVAEFANQLASAIKWRDGNSTANEANSVLMYSWNEFAEGGQVICPLLIPGTSGGVNRSMLDAVKSVTNGTFNTEKNYVKNSTFCADGQPTTAISDWLKSSPDGTEDAAMAEFANSPGYSGAFHLVHKSTNPYSVSTSQFISGLDDGTYTIIAMVKSSGGQSVCNMQVGDYGGNDLVTGIKTANSWTPVVAHINVTSGSCRISFNSVSPKNKWLMVGSVKMLAGNIAVSSPFSASYSSFSSNTASSSDPLISGSKSSAAISGSKLASSISILLSSDNSAKISSSISPTARTSILSTSLSGSSGSGLPYSEINVKNGGNAIITAAIILGILILGGASRFVYIKYFKNRLMK